MPRARTLADRLPYIRAKAAYAFRKDITILPSNDTAARPREDDGMCADTLALTAVGWILQDPDRAQRYLDLTGLEPDTLRTGLDQKRVLASALDFLANHEPDMLRASQELGIAPEEMVAARRRLAR